MDLKSGYPYWAVKSGLMHAFPPLDGNMRCDVAIVGGGITGALIADELANNGHDVIVLEQRDVGWGSSAASTALLQYEIDTHMLDLAKQFGEADAVLAYRKCAEAIEMLADKAKHIRDVDFARMDSLYYASKRSHASVLREEFSLRERHGFQVELIEPAALQDRFGIKAPVAILSQQAARVDPYRMAYRLLMRLQKSGTQVFDRTRIQHMHATSRGIQLQTAEGHAIRTDHVVLAAGYANQGWLKQKVARNRSSYALISDPIDASTLGPLKDTMVWESARPYLYMRSTGDGRLLVGGEDDSVDIPAKRDLRVQKKSRLLQKKVGLLFPALPFKPAFSWAGTFAETKDGLPFFGSHAQHGARVHFAMAYGGNGITYSMLGAGLLRAQIEKRKHPLTELFSFRRLDR
jgi:glycine/D-amino acid oxidase-like deaminating enzyme